MQFGDSLGQFGPTYVHGYGGSRWAGELDEATLYNRALSESAVIFQATKPLEYGVRLCAQKPMRKTKPAKPLSFS
jgi:hypothetical protein